MAGSDSMNEFSRFKVHILIMLMGMAVWFLIGWGRSKEAKPPEDQGEKSVSQAGIMTYYREVERVRPAISSLAGPQLALPSGRVELRGSSGAEGDLSEAAGIEEWKTLQRENDSLRRENFRLQERLDGMEGLSGRDKAQAASYPSGESEFLAEELLGKQEEIDSLQWEKEQLEAELDEIVGIANRLEEEVAELESEREGLSEEDLLRLQDQIDRLLRENGKLEDRIEELQALIEFLSGKASAGMAVIAASEETREIANQIRMRLGREEISPKQAETVLVVVLSDLENPFLYSYSYFGDLVWDADVQMDIKASMFHAYIFQINDDLSVEQIEHTTGYYEWMSE